MKESEVQLMCNESDSMVLSICGTNRTSPSDFFSSVKAEIKIFSMLIICIHVWIWRGEKNIHKIFFSLVNERFFTFLLKAKFPEMSMLFILLRTWGSFFFCFLFFFCYLVQHNRFFFFSWLKIKIETTQFHTCGTWMCFTCCSFFHTFLQTEKV